MGLMVLLRAVRSMSCDECPFSNYIKSRFYDINENDAKCRFCFERKIKGD